MGCRSPTSVGDPGKSEKPQTPARRRVHNNYLLGHAGSTVPLGRSQTDRTTMANRPPSAYQQGNPARRTTTASTRQHHRPQVRPGCLDEPVTGVTGHMSALDGQVDLPAIAPTTPLPITGSCSQRVGVGAGLRRTASQATSALELQETGALRSCDHRTSSTPARPAGWRFPNTPGPP